MFKKIVLSIFFLTATILKAKTSEICIERPMVVVIPSYNNIQWYEKNLDSILSQEFTNFRVIYIDDCSKDGTGDAVENYLREKGVDFRVTHFCDGLCVMPDLVTDHPFQIVRNINRTGALANLFRAIHTCDDDEIVVTVDGDDWLPDPRVLNRLNKTYGQGQIWLTHGKMIEYPKGSTAWCIPVPADIIARNAFREFRCPSHLRTFYAWLFKRIDGDDLFYKGEFFPMAWDMAIMFPMIEMAGERHAYVSEVNYVYNMANQINDNKVNADLQNECDRVIRAKKRYQRLESR